ncbi:patatin-like phospholipase family protein [Desulfoprunum sp.]|jgi:NTE family protein|uniref:patatin-like phospholipase family protein n=1 Tax=Desulfoprunum sp. TaxID=2020866 RepID=UPI00052E27A6|nr:patatin [Desulfobulbus sp. Tol-SR]
MKIGLALGSGSSRGWAHIGVISALIELGIEPDIICGTSIGSLVGASYVSNTLNKLEAWVCSLTKFETARFFEINYSLNGFVNTERLNHFLNEYVATDDSLIEDLGRKYAAVATELETGREVWLTRGPVLEAVWSSISLPGLFPAIRNSNKWLVDGGLVNPVPVSVCRAMGADLVIAVNLNGDIVGKHFKRPKKHHKQEEIQGVVGKFTNLVTEYTASLLAPAKVDVQPPNLFEAIAASVNITQDRITRSRMAGDPPEILLSPRLSHIGLLEFYRANEAITEGKGCVRRMLPALQEALGMV